MNKHEAQALSQMGEGVSEYNRGVLKALGHGALFDEWNGACMGLSIVMAMVRDAEIAATPADQADNLLFFPEIAPSLKAEQDAASVRKHAAWIPIEALRRQALDALEGADPFGLAQAS